MVVAVPNVVERTSQPDPELPIRVYPVEDGHKAVRLTRHKKCSSFHASSKRRVTIEAALPLPPCPDPMQP